MMLIVWAVLASVGLVAIIGALFWYAGKGYDAVHMMASILGAFLGVLLLVLSLVAIAVIPDWLAANHRARIINREYGTMYTQEEIFWASDVVDVVHEVRRTRIELNGDLLSGDSDEETLR